MPRPIPAATVDLPVTFPVEPGFYESRHYPVMNRNRVSRHGDWWEPLYIHPDGRWTENIRPTDYSFSFGSIENRRDYVGSVGPFRKLTPAECAIIGAIDPFSEEE